MKSRTPSANGLIGLRVGKARGCINYAIEGGNREQCCNAELRTSSRLRALPGALGERT
jgi:hypothetical protein